MTNEDDYEAILEMARAIRPYLLELIGDGAKEIDRSLAEMLARVRDGDQVRDQILDLLGRRQATLAWGTEFLAKRLPPDIAESLTRRRGEYERLGGDPEPPTAKRYVCPGGDYVWYQRMAAQDLPLCPTHGRELILATTFRPGRQR